MARKRWNPDAPVDLDKLRSIGTLTPGYETSTRTRVVPNDHTGERVGTQTEHWSGREDARVEAPHVHVKIPRRRNDG